jgi:hypothetical protein
MKTKYLYISVILVIAVLVGFFFISQDAEAPELLTEISEREAIDFAVGTYPELQGYETTSLPPSAIETKKGPEGWYLAFVRRGSGLPGIIDAKCYYVRNSKEITLQGTYTRDENSVTDTINVETCTGTPSETSSDGEQSGVGEPTGIALGESVIYYGTTLKPLSVEEDSRCPVTANCIQAGTVRVNVQITSGYGTYVNTLTLGKEFTTENLAILLRDVAPIKTTASIDDKEYRFTFIVTKRAPVTTVPPPTPLGLCYRGGCSGQLCSDQPDQVSTCEYREVYGCYADAVCERQANGQCGWTETETLRQCIASAT